MKTDLSILDIERNKAEPKWKVLAWFFCKNLIFDSAIPWPYSFKSFLLRSFGAKIGKAVIFKFKIRITSPWRLSIGDYCWIGEDVWIDNIEDVNIGNNVCLSQGAMLFTHNHDYTISNFPSGLGKIIIEDGVWIGAKSIVCPGVVCRSHSILTVSSVATNEMEEMKIYSGNPAIFVRNRMLEE